MRVRTPIDDGDHNRATAVAQRHLRAAGKPPVSDAERVAREPAAAGQTVAEQPWAVPSRLGRAVIGGARLPVAVGGRSSVLNLFLEDVLGRKPPDRLRMPFSTERAARMKELRDVTLPHGILIAYAGGISGDNS